MKPMIAMAALLALSATAAMAQYTSPYGQNMGARYGVPGSGSNPSSRYVQPYATSRGTEVQGHYQTVPNGTQSDNYSTRGNINPYTGAVGTRTPRN